MVQLPAIWVTHWLGVSVCPPSYRLSLSVPLECVVNSVEIMQADEQNLLDDVFVISRIKLILTSGTSDIAKMESNNCFYDIPVNCCEKQ